MAKTKLVNGKRVELTAAEILQIDAAKPPHVPRPNPNLNAAIQAIINGDLTAAQAAMDETA